MERLAGGLKQLAVDLHERMIALARDLEFEPCIELTDEVPVLKAQAAAAAERAVARAVEAVGGPAFYRRTELERLLRDVRAGHFHPLPAKQQARFTGRLALGLEPVESWTPPRS